MAAPTITLQPNSNTIPVLRVTATSLYAVSYNWYRNNTLIPGATSNTYTVTQLGTYKVRVVNTFTAEHVFSNEVSVTSLWVPLGGPIVGEAVGDYSGWSVSINDTGDRVAIGAIYNSGNGTGSGHVRVYEYSESSWTQIGSDIDGEAVQDYSGWSVSMNDAGNIVAVGAMYNDGNGSNSGHVRVYEYSGTSWTQLGSDINGEAAGDQSGFSVSINAAGSRVAIGAFLNSNDKGYQSGHVRVYEYNGISWVQIGSDIDGEAAGDQSGSSVSLNAAGDRVAISARYNDGNGSNSGHVRVYEYSGTSWTQLGSDIDGEAAGDQSGSSVSLNAAGDRVAIGASSNDGGGLNTGHVRIYEYKDSSWTQLGEDIDKPADGFSGAWGYSVSMNAAGDRVGIGTSASRANAGEVTTYAKVFEYSAAGWIDIGSPASTNLQETFLATSLNAAGNILVAGSNLSSGNSSGVVRVFSLLQSLSISTQPNNSSNLMSVTVAGGQQPYNYQWYKDGQPIPFGDTSQQFVDEIGTYYVVVTDSAGEMVQSVDVVYDPIEITVQPQDVWLNEYGQLPAGVPMSVTATGPGELQYQWYTQAGELVGTTNPFTVQGSGIFYVVVSNGIGDQVTSATALAKARTYISFHPSTIRLNNYGTAPAPRVEPQLTMVAVEVGDETPNFQIAYQWQKKDASGNFQNISGANTSSYMVSELGVYRAEVTIVGSDYDPLYSDEASTRYEMNINIGKGVTAEGNYEDYSINIADFIVDYVPAEDPEDPPIPVEVVTPITIERLKEVYATDKGLTDVSKLRLYSNGTEGVTNNSNFQNAVELSDDHIIDVNDVPYFQALYDYEDLTVCGLYLGCDGLYKPVPNDDLPLGVRWVDVVSTEIDPNDAWGENYLQIDADRTGQLQFVSTSDQGSGTHDGYWTFVDAAGTPLGPVSNGLVGRDSNNRPYDVNVEWTRTNNNFAREFRVGLASQVEPCDSQTTEGGKIHSVQNWPVANPFDPSSGFTTFFVDAETQNSAGSLFDSVSYNNYGILGEGASAFTTYFFHKDLLDGQFINAGNQSFVEITVPDKSTIGTFVLPEGQDGLLKVKVCNVNSASDYIASEEYDIKCVGDIENVNIYDEVNWKDLFVWEKTLQHKTDPVNTILARLFFNNTSDRWELTIDPDGESLVLAYTTSNGTGAPYAEGVVWVRNTDQASVQVVDKNTQTICNETGGERPTNIQITSSSDNGYIINDAPVTLTVTAEGSTPFTYQWSKEEEGELLGETGNTLVVSQEGSYFVTVANEYGSAPSAPFLVQVATAAFITTHPVDTEFTPQGEFNELVPAVLNVVAGGAPTPTYQWMKDGEVIPGATESTYSADSFGQYSVEVTNEFGTVTSDFAWVYDAPAIQITGNGFEISEEVLAITLVATATGGNGIYEYLWKLNGQEVQGFSSENGYTASLPGNYSVTVRYTLESSTGNNIQPNAVSDSWPILDGRCVAPVIDSQPQDYTGNGPAVLSVIATGSNLTYQWYRSGNQLIDGETASTLTAYESDTYYVIVSNGCGDVTSLGATVTILEVTTPVITEQPVSGEIINEIGYYQLNCMFQNADAPYTMQWYKDGIAIEGATEYIYQAREAGSYYFEVTAANGTATSDIVEVTLNEEIAVEIITQPSSGSIANGEYELSVVINNNATGIITYEWFLNDEPLTSSNSPSFVATQAGVYKVIVTQDPYLGGLRAVPSVEAIVDAGGQAPVIITQPTDGNIAYDEPYITLTVEVQSSGPVTYQWETASSGEISGATQSSYNATETGDYRVIVTNEFGFTSSEYAEVVKLTQTPIITSQPQSATIDEGSSATLSVTAVGSTPLFYQWAKDGVDISGATSNTYSASTAGSYTVTVGNFVGSITSNAAVVTVNQVAPQAPVITSHPQDITINQGQSATLSVSATGTSPLSYQWAKDGVNISGATSSTYNASVAGSYTVVVSNAAGSVTSNAAVVTVGQGSPQAPVITSHPQSDTIDEWNSVTLSVTATGTSPLSYQWAKDGVDISGATSSTYSASTAGSYTVVVSNTYGSATSNAAVVTVGQAPVITSHPQSATINEGSSVTLSVTATGTSPLSYQWAKDGFEISGATSSTYSTSTEGSYTVLVTNFFGFEISSAAVVTVNEVSNEGPTFSTQPQAAELNDSTRTVTLTVDASGTGSVTYQWKWNGFNVTGATQSTLTTKKPGVYTVVATDDNGSTTSQESKVRYIYYRRWDI